MAPIYAEPRTMQSRMVRPRPKHRNGTFPYGFAIQTSNRWNGTAQFAPRLPKLEGLTPMAISYPRSTMLGDAKTSGWPRGKTAILITMCLGVYLAQLDSTVVYLGLKHIGDDLRASVSQLQWVLDSYNLVYAMLLLTGGALGDLYGRLRVFACGIALIILGSLICALAPNGAVLIAGRAVTGLGSALEVPTSLAILTVTFRDTAERGRALGFWASCNGLAMATGPTIGGLLVDSAGWRSIFLLSVPVGLLALALGTLRVPESRHPEGRHLDPIAQVLAIVAVGALSFVTIEGQHWGWTSPVILAMAAVAAVAAIAFVRFETGRPGAMVPLDIFRNSAFNAALAVAGLMTFGMYAMLFLTPLYLQSVLGASAFIAAVELLPMSIAFVAVSQCSGALMTRCGARVMLVGGMSLMGCGLLLLAAVVPQADLWTIEVALVVIGVGLGLNTGPVNAVAVAAVPPVRSGTASGLVNTTRMVGATMGIAILGAIYAAHIHGDAPQGMLEGLRWAFVGGALGELSGALIALVFTRADSMAEKKV
jgi:DHA2 family methylenomycin A resistance protein-like MFS transporter